MNVYPYFYSPNHLQAGTFVFRGENWNSNRISDLLSDCVMNSRTDLGSENSWHVIYVSEGPSSLSIGNFRSGKTKIRDSKY